MKQITKPYLYSLLDQIHVDSNIDVSDYVSMIAGNNEIPYEAIVFINSHIPLEQFTTYNAIYDKRNNSRLFRNIVKDDLSVADKAIVLSSILNQSLISIKHDNNINKQQLISAVNIDVILNAINQYMFEGNEEIINNVFNMFRTIFKTLFPK